MTDDPMCSCSKLPAPYLPYLRHGHVRRCPACDTPWKIVVRRRGTFMTKEWDLIAWWDIPARIRAALAPKRWS